MSSKPCTALRGMVLPLLALMKICMLLPICSSLFRLGAAAAAGLAGLAAAAAATSAASSMVPSPVLRAARGILRSPTSAVLASCWWARRRVRRLCSAAAAPAARPLAWPKGVCVCLSLRPTAPMGGRGRAGIPVVRSADVLLLEHPADLLPLLAGFIDRILPCLSEISTGASSGKSCPRSLPTTCVSLSY
jgi:hypothetical protein